MASRERLRLNYAFAPRYSLPPRLGRPIALSSLLERSGGD